MRRLCSYLARGLILSVSVGQAIAGSSRGTVGFAFLRTPWAPRPAAMGGAFVAVSGDPTGVGFNPAGSYDVAERTLHASFADYLLDFATGCVAFSHHLGIIGRGEFSAAFMTYGKFQETDASGLRTGRTFGAGTIVVSETVARPLLRNLLGGVTLKYVHSYIDVYSSQAFLADFGLLFHTPVPDLDVGFAVQNVGKVLSPFLAAKDKLPLCYRIGWSKRLAHLPLLYAVELFKYPDDDYQFAIGGEFTLTPHLFLRWGYCSLARQMKLGMDADQFAGVSVGVGFLWRGYRLDYTLSSFGQLGTVNRFGLNAAL